jgi:uncharacterized LabA/DUF88 family protein
MASSTDNVSMALFCDFENVALGVRDANYEKFDIKPVLERLLLKGSIVVKKAYCDWDRYKGFKAPMHEGNFELIEIPHVRQSGKNSADIRMVVDALDLCYTKSHVNTFVIISGDSDFSPLVSKLRENNKKVIGVGVKQSTSDLLVANCDEFIFYDDLVREIRRAAAKRDTREGQPAVKRTPEEEKRRREEMDKRRREAVDMAVETFDALVSERGDSGKIWASVLKEAIKRRKPDFSESYYGFRTFGNLLEEAKARGLLEFGRDEKSGAYVFRSSGGASGEQGAGQSENVSAPAAGEPFEGRHEGRRGRGRGRNRGVTFHPAPEVTEEVAAELELAHDENAYAEAEAVHAAADAAYAQQHDRAGQRADERLSSYEADAEQGDEAQNDAARAQAEVAAADAAAKRKPPKMPARQAKAAKIKAAQAAAAADAITPEAAPLEVPVAMVAVEAADVAEAVPAKGRGGRTPSKGRGKAGAARITEATAEAAVTGAPVAPEVAPVVVQPAPDADHGAASDRPARNAGKNTGRGGRNAGKPAGAGKQQGGGKPAAQADAGAAPAAVTAPATGDVAGQSEQPARKPAARGARRPRKPDAKQGT